MNNKFRKKPVVIDAVKWTGENQKEIFEFMQENGFSDFYVSQKDFERDSPLSLYIRTLEGEHLASIGDWIIRGVKGEYYPCKPDIFEQTYDMYDPEHEIRKTLINTTASQARDNVKDIKFWGDGDTFKLISKASSVAEGWMKSTKAMEIAGVGCVVQITTQQGDNVAEAAVFVPGAKILERKLGDNVVSREIVKSNFI